ncbi:DUF4870 domain-containing protein [Bacillus toyonensis]|uniref:DUF4870 domain-containing protein n=1 Tax=Bacillus toyonensis TaxID=155322 RepID=A0A2B5XNX6_9BACI|nr:DUF4870 domain-containing protein [Bacillus toyonensis]PGB02018.1 hypothetical protein COL93_13640 [Bacillus toyonensis]PHD67978.1 hypothetical protein COF40_18455 [Bacillus toyonensis]
MNGDKILAALSYWSVLFTPILFPIIVWIMGNTETQTHAKQALWTHIIPSITACIGVVVILILGTKGFIIAGICGIISLYCLIWNIVKGIKVLKA